MDGNEEEIEGALQAAGSEAGKDLIASLQARLAHVEKLNQHQVG